MTISPRSWPLQKKLMNKFTLDESSLSSRWWLEITMKMSKNNTWTGNLRDSFMFVFNCGRYICQIGYIVFKMVPNKKNIRCLWTSW